MKKFDRCFIGELDIGDRFSFPKDRFNRIISKVVNKRGYITTYHRDGKERKSFKYHTVVIFLNEEEKRTTQECE